MSQPKMYMNADDLERQREEAVENFKGICEANSIVIPKVANTLFYLHPTKGEKRGLVFLLKNAIRNTSSITNEVKEVALAALDEVKKAVSFINDFEFKSIKSGIKPVGDVYNPTPYIPPPSSPWSTHGHRQTPSWSPRKGPFPRLSKSSTMRYSKDDTDIGRYSGSPIWRRYPYEGLGFHGGLHGWRRVTKRRHNKKKSSKRQKGARRLHTRRGRIN